MNMANDPRTSPSDALAQTARTTAAWLSWIATLMESQMRPRSLLPMSLKGRRTRQAIERLRGAATTLQALANAHVTSHALKHDILSSLHSAEKSLTLLYSGQRSSQSGKELLRDVREKSAELQASWAAGQPADSRHVNSASPGAAVNDSSGSTFSYQK